MNRDDSDTPPILVALAEADEKITAAETRARDLASQVEEEREKNVSLEGAVRKAQLDVAEGRAALGRAVERIAEMEERLAEERSRADEAEGAVKSINSQLVEALAATGVPVSVVSDYLAAVDAFTSAGAAGATGAWQRLRAKRAEIDVLVRG